MIKVVQRFRARVGFSYDSKKPGLTVEVLSLQVGGDLGLGSVSVGQKLLLIVKKLFSSLGGVLDVRSLDDGIDRTSFLAETTVDALGHIDIVSSGLPAPVVSGLRFDGNGLCRTNGLAELAGDTSLFTVRVSSEGVFSTESGRNGTLFEGVHDGVRRSEELFQDDPHSSQDFGKEEQLSRLVQSARPLAVVRILQPSDLSGFASRSALSRPGTRGTCQSVVFRVRRLDRTLLDP